MTRRFRSGAIIAVVACVQLAGILPAANAAAVTRTCSSFKQVDDGFHVAERKKFTTTGITCAVRFSATTIGYLEPPPVT